MKDFIMVHCVLAIMICLFCGLLATSNVSAYIGPAYAESDEEGWDAPEEEEEEDPDSGDET